MNNDQTINEALGISDEWKTKKERELKELLKNHNAISQILIENAKLIKHECFGENYEISEYEIKLMYGSYLICSIIHDSKMEAAQSALLSTLFSTLAKRSSEETD